MTPPPGQSSPKVNRPTPDLPKRVSKGSKKMQKAKRKRERKRAKLHRSCKKDNTEVEPGTPQSDIVTPMPSPSERSTHETNAWDINDGANASMLVSDRSLTDMLASANMPISSQCDKDTEPHNEESNGDAVLRLEARVLAANIELQGVSAERAALQQQVELLISEIDSLKKVDKTQKNVIKRLINENDKIKRDISKHTGIRRYTDSSQSRVSDSVVSDHDVVQCDKCKVLRAKLIGVTDSLLSALDDEQASNFAVVENRKRGRASSARSAQPVQRSPTQPSFAAVAASRSTVNPPSVLPHHPQPGPAPTSPRPIPVVKIGAAARHAAEGAASVQSAHAEQVRHETTETGETVVIGTSLISGLAPMLHRQGISATSYMYRGGDIPSIRSRVPNILPPGANPRHIILQVAGNDATKHPAERIATRYDGLIRDIRTRCPLSKIILSKVPPRKGTSRTMSTINKINSSIDKFAQSFHDVYSIDVCPSSLYHFRKDCTHFNAAGLKYYAENIAKVLQNFHRGHQMVNV